MRPATLAVATWILESSTAEGSGHGARELCNMTDCCSSPGSPRNALQASS
eukprot:CAMPEP_0204071032 /NCGR_PEP_ID=MMETSP0360-20130528/159410_1 /ASSEMBLY_ACC=CAM_ASM_000342 /TAXON_ID=268821 /ORGANISM="Scrippsiella Hangoei, Strain SHTV-5" /LENGTH=49 /DNA_ID= /DNA_START= /DNA_END= /DNA_ORIENTATION=